MLTCIMPVNMPWYCGVMAGALSIGIKYLFGGLGNNIFNPAALSRSILGVLFTGFSFELFGVTETTLHKVLTGNASLISIEQVLLGNATGGLGTSCFIVIACSAILLIAFKVINWENVLFSIASFVLIVWLLMGAEYILPMLLSGSFLFVVVFMLSDPTTSPYGFTARVLYSLAFGVLAAVFMKYNIMGETAVFLALLVVNFLAPVFDALFSVFKKGVKN